MIAKNKISFKSILQTVWPIYPHEIKRIVPLSLLLFLVCFDYSMLRPLKDSVVITASSAEVIPFIKLWALLPMAILFTYIYAKLSSRYSRKRVFYLLVSGFLAFFLVFAFIFYPHAQELHLHGTADRLRAILPRGLNGMIAMVEYWSYTLFYVFAELWSNIILSVLTWGFINHITSLNEAPRFYAVLGVASNLAAVAAGLAANGLMTFNRNGTWVENFQYLILLISFLGVILMLIYDHIDREIKNNEKWSGGSSHKKRPRFSLTESILEIAHCPYLRQMAVIVISYFFVINTVEVVWKEELRLLYPSPNEYNFYMNSLTAAIGFISTITAVFMANIIDRFGWTKTAMITPCVLLITSLLFFFFLVFEKQLLPIVGSLGTTPLVIAVFLGGLQNCMSKSAKYSLFDTTKEMAFIPLSREAQLKGKAAIDGIGSRLGKSGGSIAHQSLILIFGSMAASIPMIGVLMIAVILCWIVATTRMGKRLDAELAHNRESALPSPIEGEEARGESLANKSMAIG